MRVWRTSVSKDSNRLSIDSNRLSIDSKCLSCSSNLSEILPNICKINSSLFIRSTFLCCYYTPSERGLQLGIMPIYDGTCVLPCVPIIHPCPASGQKCVIAKTKPPGKGFPKRFQRLSWRDKMDTCFSPQPVGRGPAKVCAAKLCGEKEE
jgi:hypothetical protein